MIIIIRANGIFASRVSKYIEFYKKNNIPYKVLGWDRSNENIKEDNYFFFKFKSRYVQGGYKAILHKLKWMIFILKFLFKNKKNISYIHACDIDTAFPSVIFKLLFKPSVKLIFDVCDWFSASHNQSSPFTKIVKIVENITIKFSDEIIICEPERIKQIPYLLNKKELIMRNIPSFKDTSFLKLDSQYIYNNDLITFSYVGWFGKGRLIEELLKVAELGRINLLIAGFGNVEIENKCLQLNKLPNIKYFGKVNYQTALNIMFNSDLIYAMYSKTIPNHFYAAPNKYYESTLLGKPILSTKGIYLEKRIISNNIGFVIDESIDDLINFINTVKKEDLIYKGKLARKLWENKYSVQTDMFFNNHYSKIFKD